MSGNLLASSLPSSHAAIHREPSVNPSEARGHGAGFENLLAEIDRSNASASPTNAEKTAFPQAERAAPADPIALTTSHATLMTNLDAALSTLAMVASAASEPTSPVAKKTPSVSPVVEPSVTPARETATSAALAVATNEPVSVEATPNAAAPSSFVAVAKPQPAKRETVSPAVAIAPSEAAAGAVVPDIGSVVAVAIAPTSAATAAAASPPKAQSDSGPPAATAVAATPRSAPSASIRQAVAPLPPVATPPPLADVGGAASPSVAAVTPPTPPIAKVAPVVVAGPARSETSPSVVDVVSFPSASISQIFASTNGASVASTLAGGDSGMQTAFASQPIAPAPGAAPGTISHPIQIAVSFAPELGFQGLQTTTHLAVRSAASGRGPSPAPGLSTVVQAGLGSQRSSVDVASGAVAGAAIVALSAPSEFGQPKPRPAVSSANAAGAGGRVSAGVDATASEVAPPRVAPPGQANSRSESSTSQNSSRHDPGADAPRPDAPRPDAPKATEPVATNVATVTPSPAAPSSPTSINLSDLGERLASEARSLAQPEAESNGKLATAPIKELKLDLHPASLGAVAVKLKLTDGKLSVDVGVDNPNSLAAVESQRDSIISKLQAGSPPLENFVVHQQTFGASFSAQSSSQPSHTGSSGNTSGHEHTSKNDREPLPRQPRTAPSDDAPSLRNGFGAGLVV